MLFNLVWVARVAQTHERRRRALNQLRRGQVINTNDRGYALHISDYLTYKVQIISAGILYDFLQIYICCTELHAL